MILRFNVCMAQLFTSQAITSYASDWYYASYHLVLKCSISFPYSLPWHSRIPSLGPVSKKVSSLICNSLVACGLER
jgi:hypothetical protein